MSISGYVSWAIPLARRQAALTCGDEISQPSSSTSSEELDLVCGPGCCINDKDSLHRADAIDSIALVLTRASMEVDWMFETSLRRISARKRTAGYDIGSAWLMCIEFINAWKCSELVHNKIRPLHVCELLTG